MDTRTARRYSGSAQRGASSTASNPSAAPDLKTAKTVAEGTLLTYSNFGEARVAGARTIEVNLEPSAGVSRFEEVLPGLAGEVVPTLVNRLLAEVT